MLLLQLHILVDNLDTANTNSVNLRAALSAAPLFHVKKIVQGQFDFFRSIFITCFRRLNQACGLLVTRPPAIRSQMGMKLGEKKIINEYGMNFRCARQAVSGLLAVGGIKDTRYLANKMQKA
ncbi:hypothetical protein Pint_11853 [Pistacia integerrima]|uniref:Uncharacterized protein n=1 Tax=Pistacia integerrima TaxID=434235 RepID=A0ACC0XH30_9ROSI|nr:hypothetical protein Pint_11853 [Pistacia integerrima]